MFDFSENEASSGLAQQFESNHGPSALFARFRSRQDHTFAEKVLSAMRKEFGGHFEKQAVAEGKAPEDVPTTSTATSGPEFT